jgi:hypothetical protein
MARLSVVLGKTLAFALLTATLALAGELPKKFTESIEGSKEKAEGKKSAFEMVLIPGGKFTWAAPTARRAARPTKAPPARWKSAPSTSAPPRPPSNSS